MRYRLLIDLEVYEFLRNLKRRDRDALLALFAQIRKCPDRFGDYDQRSESGRIYNVHVTGRFAVSIWDDFADRQVKIMEVNWADEVL